MMTKRIPFLVLAGLLVGALAGCGATPEPAAPTQTPWIVVVTATPGAETPAQAAPTQTPWIIIATPTGGVAARPSPTTGATAQPAASAEATQPAEPVSPLPTPEPQPSPTGDTPAVATPAAGAFKYPAPLLSEPPPGGRIQWQERRLLEWRSVGALAADEYYQVSFERPPQTEGMEYYGDYDFVQEPKFLFSDAFLAPFHPPEVQGEATVYWWVQLVHKTGETADGKPLGVAISPPSERWTLVIAPKPDDA
jgi:hypothetical protein